MTAIYAIRELSALDSNPPIVSGTVRSVEHAIDELVRKQSVSPVPLQMTITLNGRYNYHYESYRRGATAIVTVDDIFMQTETDYVLQSTVPNVTALAIRYSGADMKVEQSEPDEVKRLRAQVEQLRSLAVELMGSDAFNNWCQEIRQKGRETTTEKQPETISEKVE